jgi:hypothetical protein
MILDNTDHIISGEREKQGGKLIASFVNQLTTTQSLDHMQCRF